MAKAIATGLIFSLFNATLAREVPFGIPQHTECILNKLTNVLLCVPLIINTSQKSIKIN